MEQNKGIEIIWSINLKIPFHMKNHRHIAPNRVLDSQEAIIDCIHENMRMRHLNGK